jgi:tetratricopeptide (TPR) repeat protein
MIKLVGRALALLIAAAFAAAPAQAAWMEASSPHFLIYADMSEAQLRTYAERLEHYDRALRLLTRLSDEQVGGGNRVTLYVLPRLAALQELAGSASVGGFYRPSAQGSTIFMPRRIGDGSEQDLDANQVLFHEYAHHILLSSDHDYYPGWVTEGMAEFLMTARVNDDGGVVIGWPNAARTYSVMAVRRMSARDLLSSDERRLGPEETDQKYSRGWLLIHYLLLGTDRVGQFDTYIRLVGTGMPSLQAGTQAFGDLSRLDRDLDHYVSQPRFRTVTLNTGQAPRAQVAIRQLRPGEAAMMPTRILSVHGVDRPAALRLVEPARRVATAYPADPWVQRALAEVEYDAGNDDAAEAAASRALAIDPNSVMALLYKGRVRMRRAMATPAPGASAEAWREARSWFLRANRLDPNYALPLTLFYDSFGQAGQAPPQNAIDGLLRAVELVPQDPNLRIRVAMEMLRQNNLQGMRRALAPVAYNPHRGGDNPALTIVRLIESGADRAAVTAAIARLNWGAVSGG